jgi:hypothetical protein
MRRPNQPMPGLEGLLPYALIAGFAIVFWGVTMLLWSVTFPPDVFRDNSAPNVLWTALAFLLPLMGYGALIRANPTPESGFHPTTYIGMQIFALIVWILSVWLWATAYRMSTTVTPESFVLVIILQLLPYWFWVRSARPRSTSTLEGGGTGIAPLAATRRFGRITDADSWLTWMGKGEPQRGALILIACIFWSLLYWNDFFVIFGWDTRSLDFVLKFPIWGLLTIIMLTTIRLFSRPVGPSGEVSATPDPKSKASGK